MGRKVARLLLTLSVAVACSCAESKPRPARNAQSGVRREGILVVDPREAMSRESVGTRFRHHTATDGTNLRWTGIRVPSFVPLRVGRALLSILDPIPDGYLAFYRSLDTYSEETPSTVAAEYAARIFDLKGKQLAAVEVHRLLAAPNLEVQDVRYAEGVLYFNGACDLWRESHRGKAPCGELVAVDVARGRVLWRTQSFVSAGAFRLEGEYVLTGFSAAESFFGGDKRDDVFLIRRRDGKLVASEDAVAEDALFGFKEVPEDRLQVIFNHQTLQYERRALRNGTFVRSPGKPWKDPNEEREREQIMRELEAAQSNP